MEIVAAGAATEVEKQHQMEKQQQMTVSTGGINVINGGNRERRGSSSG